MLGVLITQRPSCPLGIWARKARCLGSMYTMTSTEFVVRTLLPSLKLGEALVCRFLNESVAMSACNEVGGSHLLASQYLLLAKRRHLEGYARASALPPITEAEAERPRPGPRFHLGKNPRKRCASVCYCWCGVQANAARMINRSEIVASDHS